MKKIGYSEFVKLCNVWDPEGWSGWLSVRFDGVYVKPLPQGLDLTPAERSILTEHPLYDLTKPVLAFPCTLEELQAFDESQGLGLGVDGMAKSAKQPVANMSGEAAHLELAPVENTGLSKREQQIRVIEAAIASLSLPPMCIPTGQKKKVEAVCKRISGLFGGGVDPFKEAWQEAVNQNRIRTERHDSYSKK